MPLTCKVLTNFVTVSTEKCGRHTKRHRQSNYSTANNLIQTEQIAIIKA